MWQAFCVVLLCNCCGRLAVGAFFFHNFLIYYCFHTFKLSPTQLYYRYQLTSDKLDISEPRLLLWWTRYNETTYYHNIYCGYHVCTITNDRQRLAEAKVSAYIYIFIINIFAFFFFSRSFCSMAVTLTPTICLCRASPTNCGRYCRTNRRKMPHFYSTHNFCVISIIRPHLVVIATFRWLCVRYVMQKSWYWEHILGRCVFAALYRYYLCKIIVKHCRAVRIMCVNWWRMCRYIHVGSAYGMRIRRGKFACLFYTFHSLCCCYTHVHVF